MDNELIEFGKVLIQWGAWIIVYGLATMITGATLILFGKLFFEDTTDKVLAFVANQIIELNK